MMRRTAAAFSAIALAVAAVTACSAFSSGESPPPSADADAGSVAQEASTVDAPQVETSTGTCVPSPLDAVPPKEDPNCGGALPVDLQSSDTHCGRCNHSCLGAGCAGGLCNIRDVGTPSPFTYDARSLFGFRDGLALVGDGPALHRVDVSTGAVSDIATFSTNLIGMQLNGDTILAVAQNTGVYTVPWTGGTFTPQLASTLPVGVTSSDERIYFIDYNLAAVHLIANNAAAPWWTAPASVAIPALTSDPKNIYWLALPKPGADASTSMPELRMSPSGAVANPVIRAQPVGAPQGLRQNDGFLYWIDGAGKGVYRVEVEGSSPPTKIAQWSEPPATLRGMAFDETNVYWAVATDGAVSTGNVYSAPKCGGPSRKIATDVFWGNGLMATSDSLLWVRTTSLARVAK